MRVRDLDEPQPDPDSDAEAVARFAPTSEVAPTSAVVAPTSEGGNPNNPTDSDGVSAEGFLPVGEGTPEVVTQALALQALGFTILPVKTGGKAPSTDRWEQAVHNDPAVFLRNPGTRNYGILPPPGCFCWDVDKDVPIFLADQTATLGPLPPTRAHKSPHGKHVFYRWPDTVPRPRGPMFKRIVTRWPFGDVGQGYVVGPGSVLSNGSEHPYSVLLDEDIASLPIAWARAAIEANPAREAAHRALAEVTVVGEGMRHDAIRDKAHFIYRATGVTGEALFGAVYAWYEANCEPYLPPLDPRLEVARAIGDVTKFPVDPLELDDVIAPPAGPLFSDIGTLMALLNEVRLDPYLVDRFIVNNGLTIVAGHPKSMKSLALLQAGFAYAAHQPFLGKVALQDAYPVFVYVTEEGSRYEMRERLTTYTGLYPDAAGRFMAAYLQEVRLDRRGFERMRSGLLLVEERFAPLAELYGKPLRVLMAMDPLRDFFPAGAKWSENDAQVMGEVKQWMRRLLNEFGWLSIVLVHHLRKSAEGDSGLEMAGSGATYGAVDSTITWRRSKDKHVADLDFDDDALAQVLPAEGKVFVETRGDSSWKSAWGYDPTTGLFSTGVPQVAAVKTIESIVAAYPGVTANIIARETGIARDTVGARLRGLRSAGKVEQVGGGKGPKDEARYYPPGGTPEGLLDLDAVMSDPVDRID